jgi:hypothetical protein
MTVGDDRGLTQLGCENGPTNKLALKSKRQQPTNRRRMQQKAKTHSKFDGKKKAAVVAEEDFETETETSILDEDQELEMDVENNDHTTLIKDDDDQQYLDSLPELEREAVLGERYEKLIMERDIITNIVGCQTTGM